MASAGRRTEPIDALDAAVIAIAELLDEIAAALPPIAPLKDGEPAPRWPLVDHP